MFRLGESAVHARARGLLNDELAHKYIYKVEYMGITKHSDFTETKKESLRKKSLGELGELYAIKTMVDHEFDRIRNINDDHMNEKFADIICEKDKTRFVVSVKSRNMYQLDGDSIRCKPLFCILWLSRIVGRIYWNSNFKMSVWRSGNHPC